MKRIVVPVLLMLVVLGASCLSAQDSARELHERAVVIDSHSDTAMRLVEGNVDFGVRSDKGHMDLPRLQEGGVDVQFFACWTDPKIGPEKMAPRILSMIDAVYRQLDRYPNRFELARSAADIRRIQQAGKTAAVLAIEGGHAIVNNLGILRMYHRLGVLAMTLTWMNNNEWADGSGPQQEQYGAFYGSIRNHDGLTDFGRDVIREMNRLGMIVDISHVSENTFWDVMEVTTKPVIASHSCAWTLHPHHRNLKDDQLRALAKNGGVIGINFYPAYLAPQETPVDIKTVIDHIDHAVKTAGIDHVGLGSDFDGIDKTPDGLEDCTDMPAITAELLKRGYSEKDILQILGGNFLRVIEAVTGS